MCIVISVSAYVRVCILVVVVVVVVVVVEVVVVVHSDMGWDEVLGMMIIMLRKHCTFIMQPTERVLS